MHLIKSCPSSCHCEWSWIKLFCTAFIAVQLHIMSHTLYGLETKKHTLCPTPECFPQFLNTPSVSNAHPRPNIHNEPTAVLTNWIWLDLISPIVCNCVIEKGITSTSNMDSLPIFTPICHSVAQATFYLSFSTISYPDSYHLLSDSILILLSFSSHSPLILLATSGWDLQSWPLALLETPRNHFGLESGSTLELASRQANKSNRCN